MALEFYQATATYPFPNGQVISGPGWIYKNTAEFIAALPTVEAWLFAHFSIPYVSHDPIVNSYPLYMIVNGLVPYGQGTALAQMVADFRYVELHIKRIQRYKFTKQDFPQSLCSLKETGYTKITSFRKWSL